MKNILFIALILSSFFSFAQKGETIIIPPSEILQQVKIDVVYLASDYLQGRETGTVGEGRAANYIVHRFHQIGLTPQGESRTWFQEFPFFEITNPHAPDKGRIEGKGKNVIGFIDNGAKTPLLLEDIMITLEWAEVVHYMLVIQKFIMVQMIMQVE